MASIHSQCHVCKDEKDLYECKGCSDIFCFNHLSEHRETLNQTFHQIQDSCNEFRQTLIDHKANPNQRQLIQQLYQWRDNAIEKINQTTEQCEQLLIRHTDISIRYIENELKKLAQTMQETKSKMKIDEKDLNEMKDKLTKLQKELDQPENVLLRQGSTSFIAQISVIVPTCKC